MSPWQTAVIGGIGGMAAVIGLIAFVGLALALYLGIARLLDTVDAWRTRRAERRRTHTDLATCQAIDALGTTTTDHD